MLFTVFVMQRLTSLPQSWFFQCFGPGSGTSLASRAPTADQTQRSENWIPRHQSCSASGRSWGNQIQQRSWRGRPGSLERQKGTSTNFNYILYVMFLFMLVCWDFIRLISWSTSQKSLKQSTASMSRNEEVSSSQQNTSKARRVLLRICTAVVI